jgi:hypothetical protein
MLKFGRQVHNFLTFKYNKIELIKNYIKICQIKYSSKSKLRFEYLSLFIISKGKLLNNFIESLSREVCYLSLHLNEKNSLKVLLKKAKRLRYVNAFLYLINNLSIESLLIGLNFLLNSFNKILLFK